MAISQSGGKGELLCKCTMWRTRINTASLIYVFSHCRTEQEGRSAARTLMEGARSLGKSHIFLHTISKNDTKTHPNTTEKNKAKSTTWQHYLRELPLNSTLTLACFTCRFLKNFFLVKSFFRFLFFIGAIENRPKKYKVLKVISVFF